MPESLLRRPAVAGTFYPGRQDKLQRTLDEFFGDLESTERSPALGAVIPHAGYVYSGKVAAMVYGRLEIPAAALLLCPNHTGLGPSFSVWPGGRWLTPLGEAPVDEELTRKLLECCPQLTAEPLAHMREHANEVHVPFLQRLRPDIRIAAIVVGGHSPANLRALGEGIARAIGELERDVLVVASSDMNHYESHERTLEKDRLAIDRLLAMDAEGLLATCRDHDISMCGAGPAAAVLWAALARGASEAELVAHCTSGEVSGDYDHVVGYAGVIFR